MTECPSTVTLEAADNPGVSAVLHCDLPAGHRGRHHAHLGWTVTEADPS